MDSTFTNSSWCSGTPTAFTHSSSTSMAECLNWQGSNLYEINTPQQATWAPSSAIRADATQDRFTMPKASVAVDGRGIVTLGLSKKPHLRIMGPAFEQAKAQENYEHMVSQQAGQQKGRRFAAANEFQQQVQQQRAREEEEAHKKRVEGLTGALNMLPKYVTSNDNVLADTLTISPAKQQHCASPCSSRPASRPHSPEVTLKAQRALKGHLAVGSLVPEDESESEAEGDDEEQAAEENVRGLGVMAAAEAAYMQVYTKEEQIVADYPHGAPKCTRRDLVAQGGCLPALGFTSRGTFEVPR